MAAAIRTGQPFFAVYEVTTLEIPLGTIWGKEVTYARASAGNGVLKHLLCHPMQVLEPGDGQPIGSSVGMQTGPEQNLIGIDVPDSCNHLLVHQERLEPTGAALHDLKKLLPGDGERVAAEPAGKVVLQTAWIE